MKKIILIVLICLLLPLNVFAVTYGKTGATTEFNGDIGTPSGSSYYINGAKQVLINKWDATVPPDVNNDIDEGYTPGSIWVDITNDISYTCVDNTDGVAIWEDGAAQYIRAGEAIKKGQAVYISGALGAARPIVSLCDADDSAKIRMIGMAIQDIANGADGFIKTVGQIKEVDTEGVTDVNPNDEDWTAGDRLYVMLDGSGGLTNVRPTSGRVIQAGYTQLGDHNSDTLFVIPHVNAVDLAGAVGENIRIRLGASDDSTGIIIKDYTDAEVAKIDDGGSADFTDLILDTALSPAEGGTGVANAAGETITLVGDDALEITTGGATTVTFPTIGTLLAELDEDADPQLGADLDCNDHHITETETVKFQVYAIGNSGSTETIDWNNGAYQTITIDEACVISFSNEYVGTLNLRVTYGGSFALTFDGGVTLLEEGGVEIVTTDAAGVDVLIFKNWGTADTYDMGALLDVKD